MEIPQNYSPKRVRADGPWGGANWTSVLNPAMLRFMESINSKNWNCFRICDYSPEWEIIGKNEIDYLTRALSQYSWFKEVQHIGSTSIPGMAAKPCIDLIVASKCAFEIKEFHQAFFLLGYATSGDPTFLFKKAKDCEICVTIIHRDNLGFNLKVLFRDHFLANPHEISDYMALKRGLIKKSLTAREYMIGKQNYITSILQRYGYSAQDLIDIGLIYKSPDDTSIPMPKDKLFEISNNTGGDND